MSGGIAAGIFGSEVLDGFLGGRFFIFWLVGSIIEIACAGLIRGRRVCNYDILKNSMVIRQSEEEIKGSDLFIHHIGVNPESDTRRGF